MDPLFKLEMALRGLSGVDSIARAAVPKVAALIDQRFSDGRAPVRSGDLRKSVRTEAAGGQIQIGSDLPYAQFHRDEITPSEAELEGALDRAAEGYLDSKLRGI